jgi:branched-chain amino acid transport system ATP-binding protein
MAEERQILTIQGISKSFGGLQALDDVHLGVLHGGITSLIGPNGAGKTTLFNIVSGILAQDAGSIFLDGLEISKMKGHEIARLGVARTFQNLRPFKNMNVLENVMVSHFYRQRFKLGFSIGSFLTDTTGRKRAREEAEELLKLMGLQDKRFHRPTDLPYGSQRKLEISRAMALRPKVLLLDEPFSGMTPTEASELMKCILDLKSKGLSIFLIEHNMHVVMGISDWIVVLNFGEIIAAGNPNDVRNDPLVKEAYLGKS